MQILRDGKKQTFDVTIGTMPRDKNAQLAEAGASATQKNGSTVLGLSVQDLNSGTRQQLGLKAGEGVAVADVTGAVAAQAGLQAGDVILMVNQTKVGSAAAFRTATAGVKPGDTVLLLVRSGDTTNFVGLTVPSDKQNG